MGGPGRRAVEHAKGVVLRGALMRGQARAVKSTGKSLLPRTWSCCPRAEAGQPSSPRTAVPRDQPRMLQPGRGATRPPDHLVSSAPRLYISTVGP